MSRYCSLLPWRPMELSLKQARRLILMQQGLLQPAPFGRGRAAVLRAIERLHHVQIDTISVVDRAHHHILQSRVPGYRQDWLHQLQSRDRTVFEYWYHAAAYLPMTDYRFYLPLMRAFAKRRPVDKKLRKEILARIKSEGVVEARDFEHPEGRKSSGWWDWKPAKLTMERMFFSGELMVKERQGFRKIYDLTENLLPTHVDTSFPTARERGEFYVRRMLLAQGIASERDILYVQAVVKNFSGFEIKPVVKRALQELVEAGEVTACVVEKQPFYGLASVLGSLRPSTGKRRLRFLSPFDNVVINRRRLGQLFGFDYTIECYVPAPKRKYGYFCLPILYGAEFVGRMDCKAERKDKVLQVNQIWFEAGVKVDDALQLQFEIALQEFSKALACEKVSGSFPIQFGHPIRTPTQFGRPQI